MQVFSDIPKIDEVFESENKAHIFPNPSTGIFSIEIKDDTINDIYVFNSSGECVYVDANIAKSDYSLNLTGFAKGVYYVAIQGAYKQYKNKIIIN